MDFKLKNGKYWLSLSSIVLCLLVCFSANAAEKPVAIITDHQAQPHYRSIISSFKQSLSTHNLDIQIINFDEKALIEATLQNKDVCVISIGSQSFEKINKASPACSLSLLVSRNQFQQSSATFRRSASAIYLNQPLARIAAVLRQTLKHAQKASIVVSNDWPEDIDIKNTKMDFYIKHIDSGDSIIQAFRQASRNTDFVIAIPDANIYNKSNIKNILLTTYKAKTPLIGYSMALSRAGSLISVYTPAEQLGRQAAEWFINGHKKMTGAPKYFKVELNQNVAKSLNIKLKNKTLFKRKIWTDNNE